MSEAFRIAPIQASIDIFDPTQAQLKIAFESQFTLSKLPFPLFRSRIIPTIFVKPKICNFANISRNGFPEEVGEAKWQSTLQATTVSREFFWIQTWRARMYVYISFFSCTKTHTISLAIANSSEKEMVPKRYFTTIHTLVWVAVRLPSMCIRTSFPAKLSLIGFLSHINLVCGICELVSMPYAYR